MQYPANEMALDNFIQTQVGGSIVDPYWIFLDCSTLLLLHKVGKEPSGPSREPSHILLPLARLVGIWSWRAEPRASHYKDSAPLAVKPPRLARTANRAYIRVTYI